MRLEHRVKRLEQEMKSKDTGDPKVEAYYERFNSALFSIVSSMPEDTAQLLVDEIRRRADLSPDLKEENDLPTLPSGIPTYLYRTVLSWCHQRASRCLWVDPVMPGEVCRYLEGLKDDPHAQWWTDTYVCLRCAQPVPGTKLPEEPRRDPFENCPHCDGRTEDAIDVVRRLFPEYPFMPTSDDEASDALLRMRNTEPGLRMIAVGVSG